jgi:hypothetical protein
MEHHCSNAQQLCLFITMQVDKKILLGCMTTVDDFFCQIKELDIYCLPAIASCKNGT